MNAPPVLLAAEDSNKAGPIGLLVIILLCIACYFLYRSMSRHLRRVREQFPGAEPAAARVAADPAAADKAASMVDTSTAARSPEEVVTSTSEEPPPRFVPPVRPTPAVSRPSDASVRESDGQE